MLYSINKLDCGGGSLVCQTKNLSLKKCNADFKY